MNRTSALSCILALCTWGLAPLNTQGQSSPSLSHEITPEEMLDWQSHPSNRPDGQSNRGIPTPPPGNNLRTAAEWEEVEVLTLTWEGFPCILKQIATASVQECRVLIFSENPNETLSYLSGNACGGPLSLDSVEVVDAATNSIWIRDYGANTVYTDWHDGRVLVDWLYNRPRPDDDAIPDALAEHLALALHTTSESPGDLMNTGGNWMCDGFGTAFASELILQENAGGPAISWGQQWGTYPDHTEQEIDEIVQAYHGVHTYIKMPVLPYDGIHHIDMHMKLLDESTLLVSEYPAGTADGPQIEANLQFVLSNFTTKWGTPFNVIRIPSPPEQGGGYPNQNGDYLTYSNATFVNNTILVPTYYTTYDTTAIRIWEEAMPGYNVVGIDCDSPGENIIGLSGAIHCITHTVGVADPLMISHLPLSDTEDTVNGYNVVAEVGHRSGIASATLNWSTSPDGPWTQVPMTEGLVSLHFSEYSAIIPAQAEGTKVHYYVQAEANNGKTGARPMPAPQGWWDFRVMGEEVDQIRTPQDNPWGEVYPNPASAITCLELNLATPTDCSVLIHNSMGQTVQVLHQGILPGGLQRLFLNAQSLPSGPYHLSLITEEGRRWTKRLVVQH